jgi:hypothetical protein
MIVMAIGLVGYALWLFVQAVVDPQHKGSEPKGIAKRIGYVVSGVAYSGLAFTAFRIIQGSGSNDKNAAGAGGRTQDMTQWLLSLPMGRFLVILVGLILLGIAANTLYSAFKGLFRKSLRWSEMNAKEQQWATRAAQFGLSAKAIVSGIIGGFLVQAGWTANPNEARGLDGALKVLSQQTYGPWLLGLVAVGLCAYGTYSFFVESRYRRILTN